MKKKITAIFLCVALVAIAIVGASLAYFTDSKSAENTFTMGNVQIKLDETNVNDPTGDRVTSNTYNAYPGAVVTKDPIVHNTGKNAAYIRAKVEVKGWETNREKYPNYVAGELKDSLKYLIDGLGEGWSLVSATAANEDVTFVLKYDGVLAAGAKTTAMFQQVKVPAGLTNTDVFGTITVKADAIQTDGFDTWEAAFAKFPTN